jgi:hypothetical protein
MFSEYGKIIGKVYRINAGDSGMDFTASGTLGDATHRILLFVLRHSR